MLLYNKFYFSRGLDGAGCNGNKIPEEVFDECVSKWPQFKKAGNFHFNVYAEHDSTIIKEIISYIEERTAKRPLWQKFPFNYYDCNHYHIDGERYFEMDESQRADYFWCYGQKELTKTGFRQDNCLLEVERKSITDQAIGRSLGGFNILFKESIKELIFNQDFQNLVLKPVRVKGKLPPKELLWEVWSEKSLPSVLNPLVNELGEEPDESAHGCWVNDLYFPPVLKFNKAEVEAELGEFDVAITKERWYGGVWQRRSPYIIVSRRFREWCVKNKFKMIWVPVEMV